MANGRQYHMNTDGKQRWMDDVLRRVAEENMNPDDRSLGMRRALTAEEEAMSQAVLAEREEPYMGNLGRAIGAIRDFKFPSGPQVPLAGIRGVTPTVGAGDLPNVAKDMALPLLASDLGAAGTMANVPIPFPGMGKKPVQAGAKKFVPRKKPYINKTDPITEATSKISDDYQFLDATRKSKVARAGLSKGRYQQLLDDGYDFDDIMREYPRLGPDEWVDIEDVAGRPKTFQPPPTPKPVKEKGIRVFRGTTKGKGGVERGDVDVDSLPFGEGVYVTPDKKLASTFGDDVTEYVLDAEPSEIFKMTDPIENLNDDVVEVFASDFGIWVEDVDEARELLAEQFDDMGDLYETHSKFNGYKGTNQELLDSGYKAVEETGMIGPELMILSDAGEVGSYFRKIT